MNNSKAGPLLKKKFSFQRDLISERNLLLCIDLYVHAAMELDKTRVDHAGSRHLSRRFHHRFPFKR